MDFLKEKVKYMDMDLDEKRARYLCKNSYVTLDDIPTWREYSENLNKIEPSLDNYGIDETLNSRVSIFVGDHNFGDRFNREFYNTGLFGGYYAQAFYKVKWQRRPGSNVLAPRMTCSECSTRKDGDCMWG
ncbi:hypothetical protein AVEN_21390-1 [Araneus ventricosus]|uniref:Uncharacterized protein n=1 Tax=Araneus ventricosus TaxID=182803 RepID=A0A4Y2R7N2_ARAVE|nr:hypothetical protein AVEN_21390-1 [Araneus ventricosus]